MIHAAAIRRTGGLLYFLSAFFLAGSNLAILA
jgi:hypothetical protein